MPLIDSLRAVLGSAGLASTILTLVIHTPAAAQKAPRAERPAITVVHTAASAPSLFGTTAIPIRAQRFAVEWNRAQRDASWHPALQTLVAPARGLSPEDQIAFVQSAVHQRIKWRSDATEWGVHDYWASATETLDRGVGDMEDRAIVKMQALKLLGFPERDLFLTLGRDKVGGAIAVLIARLGDRHYVLDDLGGRPVRARLREGFTPQLSFGSNAAWAHATRTVRTSIASSAVAAPN